MLSFKRTLPNNNPYWKFKPIAYYNETGKQWEIYFEDASYYSKRSEIKVTLHINSETKKVAGLTIYEEDLSDKF